MKEKLKPKMIEIVENQVTLNNPKCTKENLERLMDLGYSREESILMIGGVLAEEMYELVKSQTPFNEKRYANRLADLP